MRKSAILAVCAVCLTLPARAAEKPATAAGGRPGTNVDMPFLMAPLTNADGRLTGYAYIAARLTASSETAVVRVRDKLPFMQDAFVRDVNGAPVAAADDPQKVDIPAVEARLLADAQKIMGPGKVRQITICTVQIAGLHPVQTPARTAPPPGTTEKNSEISRCGN
ncbi:MAG TPA: hypothetical protein VHC40_09910 [Rhizomicrobium sp.]|nr:hypothetical protein [Rhizomicrobium sp.]